MDSMKQFNQMQPRSNEKLLNDVNELINMCGKGHTAEEIKAKIDSLGYKSVKKSGEIMEVLLKKIEEDEQRKKSDKEFEDAMADVLSKGLTD